MRERIQVICARRYFPVSQPRTCQKGGATRAGRALHGARRAAPEEVYRLQLLQDRRHVERAPVGQAAGSKQAPQIRHWPDHPLRALSAVSTSLQQTRQRTQSALMGCPTTKARSYRSSWRADRLFWGNIYALVRPAMAVRVTHERPCMHVDCMGAPHCMGAVRPACMSSRC